MTDWSAVIPVTAWLTTVEHTAFPMIGTGGWVSDPVSRRYGFCWVAPCRWCRSLIVVENANRPTPLVDRWSDVVFVHRDSREPDCAEHLLMDPDDWNHHLNRVARARG